MWLPSSDPCRQARLSEASEARDVRRRRDGGEWIQTTPNFQHIELREQDSEHNQLRKYIEHIEHRKHIELTRQRFSTFRNFSW